MTKQDFVSEVARRSGLSNKDAGRAVDAFIEVVTDTLKRRGDVTFTGFGKFSTTDRAARMGVNPRNPSEKVHIAAATVPKFSAGSSLKSAIKLGLQPMGADSPGDPDVKYPRPGARPGRRL
jgi:DNA-binding protein HU-beta